MRSFSMYLCVCVINRLCIILISKLTSSDYFTPLPETCIITMRGSNKQKKVSAKSLQTADKENLSDRDLLSLIKDHGAVLWKAPGSNKLVECTLHQFKGTNVASILIMMCKKI